MELYLVYTDDNYSWIDKVDPMPNEYWEQYKIGLGYNPLGKPDWNERKLYTTSYGVIHRGPSYLFDVDIWNWKGDYPENSLSHKFSKWYKRWRRDKLINQLI
jgi:hypothetical protein